MPFRLYFLLVILFSISGCATSPATGPLFEPANYDQLTTPQQSVADIETLQGTNVLWGGMIISGTNLENSTQLEVLAYPLNSSQRPDVDQQSLGRVLVVVDEYLEPVDYAPIRLITAGGRLANLQTGNVGTAQYIYPVVVAEKIHLWADDEIDREPRINFGFGFIFSN